MNDKEIQVREKEKVATRSEHTRPGIVFSPPVDIFETNDAITVLADMPGVAAGRVDIDLRDDQLTISGDVESPQSKDEHVLLQEYDMGRYMRKFTVSDRIDQSGISASMNDGVLRVVLPKAEKARPRKIEVRTA